VGGYECGHNELQKFGDVSLTIWDLAARLPGDAAVRHVRIAGLATKQDGSEPG
jgi:hypothetical protein